ncbi:MULTISPECIES: APC family permease [Sphingomonadales]|jgi:APA family basic amino acid/polyamine antiporter|uniref:APC family permease n=1 Tax=Sphingomonadales TaxID=204457 RepID=UPI000826959D|nr:MULTISPECIES: APC family permease [Sphingomonadales]
MNQPPTSESLLRREIGRIGVATIAMNGVIGSGIFALPAIAIAQSGYFSPWIFLLCGVLIISVALSLARAASFFDITGGPIVYTTYAFGRFVGFQTGLLIYVSRVAAIAASATLIVSYSSALWSPLESGLPRMIAVAAFIFLATLVNVAGVRAGMLALYMISTLKLLPLLLLMIVGLPEIEWSRIVSAEVVEPKTLGETMLILMYAFIGFEFSLINAGETKDARQAIPRTLVATVSTIAVCYAFIQMVAVSVGPDLGPSETPLIDLAGRLMGPTGAAILAAGVVFSVGGGTLTSFVTAPRLTFALSRDGSLPAWFGEVSEQTGAPVNSITFCGILCFALAVGQGFVWLVTLSTFVRLLVYVLCIASLRRIERTIPAQPDQFQLSGGLAIPAVGLALTLWLISHSTLENFSIAGLVVGVGTVIFWLSTWRRRKPTDRS